MKNQTTSDKAKPGLPLAGDPGADEKTENPHPLFAYYTPPQENVKNYLDELLRLSDQASRQGLSLLALELSIVRARHFAAQLRGVP